VARTVWIFGGALGLVALASCALPLDILGEDETVTQSTKQQAPTSIQDDNINDKHPVYDPNFQITEQIDGCTITLNNSAAVTKLDVLPFGSSDASLNGKLYPTRAKALDALGDREVMPSMEIVNGALKPFNDGLYAAVELGAEDGSDGSPIDKRALFNDLLVELLNRAATGAAAEKPLAREAAAQIGAAVELGGAHPALPSDVEASAQKLRQEFDADTLSSQPIGFYTWTPELESIFRRDRFLQSPESVAPSFGAFAETALALNGSPDLASRYGGELSLYAGLTNPFYDLSLQALMPLVPDASGLGNLGALQNAFDAKYPQTQEDPTCASTLAFVPSSDSPESRLFRELYCDTGLPENQDLIDVLISAVQSGEINLAPTKNSGWYDRQLWALETLLVPDSAPEKDHLFLTARYKKKLIETFKSLITQDRETHVKQLGVGDAKVVSGQVAPVDIYPVLPVEPFPTFYLRTARAYVFLQGLLKSALGPKSLQRSARLTEDGTLSSESLGDELEDKILLSYGLYAVAARSIGMKPALDADETVDLDAAEQRARAWLANWRSDPDVNRDPRVIVPVEHDLDNDTIRYWAVVGESALKISESYYPGHDPKILNTDYCVAGKFVTHEPYTLVEQQVEVAIPDSVPPPTRAEFRALCNHYDNVADIEKALESL
jgi:hypothetical protein